VFFHGLIAGREEQPNQSTIIQYTTNEQDLVYSPYKEKYINCCVFTSLHIVLMFIIIIIIIIIIDSHCFSLNIKVVNINIKNYLEFLENILGILNYVLFFSIKKTPWSESASELYRPSDRRLSAK
jgi:hypothetical protein